MVVRAGETSRDEAGTESANLSDASVRVHKVSRIVRAIEPPRSDCRPGASRSAQGKPRRFERHLAEDEAPGLGESRGLL